MARLTAVVGLVLAALGASAAAASADSLSVVVQASTPEQGIPLNLNFSGSAATIDNSGDGPYLYAVVRPAGGIGCQSSYGSDQAAAGAASSDLFGQWNEMNAGQYSDQTTYNPPNVGSYLVCAWLENGGGDGEDGAFPSSDVTAGPMSATFTTRGPQVAAFSVSLGSAARPNVAYQINYTTQTDQQLTLNSVVKPAGGLPCASSYELEQQANQSEDDIFGGGTSVFGGPTTTSATDTESKAGSYVICSWIEGPNDGEVDAALSTPIYVGTPPPPPPCTVPRYGGARLATVEGRLASHYCSVGRITYLHSAARRGTVIGLSRRPGLNLAYGAKVGIFVSEGPKPKRKHHKK